MRMILPLMLALLTCAASAAPRFPGEQWTKASPASVGLDVPLLREVADYLGGRGCIVRHGQMVFQWGDAAGRGDVASAAKPWYTTFLWLAAEEGLLKSVDTPVAEYVPALNPLNPNLQHKDRDITFAHMGNQVSCYGVKERPGTAYDYNDWQMALFIDTLFHEVYGATWETLDRDVLHAHLTDILHCEDNPTFLVFGTEDRPGRLGVSPRDFARLGWLYLNGGNWNGTQVLPTEVVRRAVGSPLPHSIPRTAGVAAAMIEGQRTLGSRDIPDNQTDHYGSYSWAWWVNGTGREGNRFWPDAPLDVFTALGHENGQRGMAAIPSLDLVIAWNDTTLGNRRSMPHPLNEVFRLIMAAAEDAPMAGQVIVNPANPAWLARKTDDGPTPLLLCGPGDPEGFLYRGERLADGKRDGDQAAIIGKIRGTGANALYIQAVRSHGGDGDATHNPFVDSDPAKGIDENILQQWEGWFCSMDDAGIVIYLFLYDSASIWDTGDVVGDTEHAFLEKLVNRLEHHRNLVWCIAEEYQERFSPARIRAIAEVIRAADEHDHVIAVHKLDGLDFSEFADDPNIDQFAIQYNQPDADALHAGLVSCWENAAGRYNLNLSEAADHGFGRDARRRNWAAALAGAHSMPLGWLFDDEGAPSRADLEGCGHLVRFFETSATPRMAPHDELAAEGTIYLLAAPGEAYLAYGGDRGTPLGLRDVPRGRYALTWFDPATGAWVDQGAQTLEGDVTLLAPDGLLEDAARLGPLPGWTLGYGFDLVEWTTPEGRNGWAEYLHEKMGWDHLLCTRGFKLDAARNNMVSYSGFGGIDLSTTRGGPVDFAEVVEDLDANTDSPSFYEERHSYQRDGFRLDMNGTRRLRWWQAMAGGLGGFFGFYEKSPHPYPNPEQLRTVKQFWDGRLRLDLARAPGLSDAHCLKAKDSSFYVFYREDADTIRADLNGAAGAVHAVAVDAKAAYAEIDLGMLDPGMQTFQLPHVSDWVVAVGNASP